jgi:hypothetical protein
MANLFKTTYENLREIISAYMNMSTEIHIFFCVVPPFPNKLCAREK